jgi:prepilin-type N-terminal cleavage/methylation domain-containing protein
VSDRGSSLIELMVSLALISVAVLAAASLIVQSVRVFDSLGRSMSDPEAVIARSWMRKDVHSARSIESSTGIWSDHELVLATGDGGAVIYEQDGDRLLRRVIDRNSTETEDRTLLHGLVEWRWRVAGSRVIEVELVLPRHLDPATAALVSISQRRAEVSLRRETLVLALRQGGGSSW